MIEVRRLSAGEGRDHLKGLAGVLRDCVEGNSSVSFMLPFTQQQAEEFFARVVKEVEAGGRILLAAFLDEEVVGTVQLVTSTPPNQPHRADVAKLLVSRAARGQGVATRLMERLEQEAARARKTLLVLDTVTGERAERLYLRLGWTRVGVIPDYALFPDGRMCDTTVFYKKIA